MRERERWTERVTERRGEETARKGTKRERIRSVEKQKKRDTEN